MLLAPEDLSILIVDDNEYGRILTATTLKNIGVKRVVDVSGAVEAIAHLQSSAFHVVVIDWYMPEINGAGLVRLMKLLKIDVPVVVCTAYAMKDNLKRMSALGLTHVMVKPVNDDAFVKQVWAAIRDHAAANGNDELGNVEIDSDDSFLI